MAISIEFLSKIAKFLKGTDEIGDALDDVSDELEDLSKDAKTAGDKTGKALEDGAEKGARAIDKLDDSLGDMADTARTEGDQAGRGISDGVSDGTDSAKRDIQDMADDAKGSLADAVSDFDGSVGSMTDALSGGLGLALAAIPVAGVVAQGAVQAIGKGFEESAARAEELKQKATELAIEIREAGGSITDVDMAGVLQTWSLELSNTSQWWDVFGDKTQTNLAALIKGAEYAGTSVQDMMSMFASNDQAKATDMIDDLSGKLRKLDTEIANLASAGLNSDVRTQGLREEQKAISDMLTVLEERTGITREATDTVRDLDSAFSALAATEEATAAAEKARAEASSALQSELDAGVKSWNEYIDAETGATDPAAYIDAMAQRAAATTNFNGNVQSLAAEFGLSQAEMQAILDQGISFAPMLQSIIDSGLAPEFIAQIQAAVGGGQELINGTPLDATVNVGADTGAAEAGLDQAAQDRDATVTAQAQTGAAATELNATADKKRTATITAKAEVTAASRDLDNVAAKSRTATIVAGVDLSAAERALTEFVNRRRETTIVANVVDRSGKAVP